MGKRGLSGNAEGALKSSMRSFQSFLLISPACVCTHTSRIYYKRNNKIWSKIASAGSFLRWGEGNASRHVVFVARPGLSEVAVTQNTTIIVSYDRENDSIHALMLPYGVAKKNPCRD
jgi:hypothetical protein